MNIDLGEIAEVKYSMTLYGEKIEIDAPSAEDSFTYQDNCTKIIKGELKVSEYDLSKEFLLKVGMKEELIKKMTLPHMIKLINSVIHAKKI